jgi:hypothetical protein
MDSAACLACVEAMSGGKRIFGSEFVAMTRVPPLPPLAAGFESTQAPKTTDAQRLYALSQTRGLRRVSHPGFQIFG